MTTQIIKLEKTEKIDEYNVVLKFSDGSEEKANKNKNGTWVAYGTDNGNSWETDECETLEELVDDLEIYKTEKANA